MRRAAASTAPTKNVMICIIFGTDAVRSFIFAYLMLFYFFKLFLNMRSVSIHTLGCKLNYSESSFIAKQFTDKGIELRQFGEKSDIFVLNTCTVTSHADRECRQIIRRVLKDKPDTFVVVTGCYAQLQPGEIAGMEGVDLVLGSNEKYRIIDYISNSAGEDISCVEARPKSKAEIFVSPFDDKSFIGEAYSSDVDSRTRAFLKIQDGCDYQCSYCTIPLARGNSRSLSIEKVVENANKIIDAGYKEIILTGVNIGDFKIDGKNQFFELLQALDKLSITRIRISSIEPNLLTDDILMLIENSERFVHHFHIPLQSGDNEVLKLMRRRYMRELYESLVYKIKSKLPDSCIGADVIVGFPGESNERFESTYDFIKSLPVDYLHVFSYSERPLTHSVDIPDKVNGNDIKNRSRILRNLSVSKRAGFYARNEGKVQEVLFETEEKGMIEGWTRNYVRVKTDYSKDKENSIFLVKIKKSEGIRPVECEIIKQEK
jgi:threonylcarbamoyladenosine tRNA methylthiotransferase MtaB